MLRYCTEIVVPADRYVCLRLPDDLPEPLALSVLGAKDSLVLAPGFALFLTVIAFNLIGDGLREALDPRAQGAVEPSVLITSDQRRATSPAPSPEGGDPTPAKCSAPELK